MTNIATTTPAAQPNEQVIRTTRLLGKDVGIPVRKMGLSYDENIPGLWFNNNAFLTMMFSGFSATLPAGEAHFIHSVRQFQDKITDPVLMAQVRAFIGQEGHHSKEHDTFNSAMKRNGLDLSRIEKRMKSMTELWKSKLSPTKNLAMTVCAEHFTALLADFTLSKHPEVLEMMTPQVRKIWAWHSIEEIEHKAVAFDVYDQFVGDRKLLRRTMVEISTLFMATSMINALTLMPRSELTNWSMWKEAFGIMGKLHRSSWSDYKDFYKIDFHPWQHNSSEGLKNAKLNYLGETI